MIRRAMGLDLGTKTIGVALSDPMYRIAQAHTTIRRESLQKDLEALAAIIEQESVDEIIMGLPKHMNNTQGSSAQRSKSFAREIELHLGKAVIFQDERMSTLSANRVLMESGVRREKRKAHIDAIAATFILQTWLDRQRLQQ